MRSAYRLGTFDLKFGQEGKLTSLSILGRRNILQESSLVVEFPSGKRFSPGGWDECFPTIDPHAGFEVMGDLIGRQPILASTFHSISQSWQTPSYRAVRLFEIARFSALTIQFQVHWQAHAPLEFLWASHALFSCSDLTEVSLPNRTSLKVFQPNGTAEKSFLQTGEPIILHYPDYSLDMTTDQPWWGIWMNRGGWPDDQPELVSCIGIEATNSPTETPAGAVLQPGETFSSTVTLSVR